MNEWVIRFLCLIIGASMGLLVASLNVAASRGGRKEEQ